MNDYKFKGYSWVELAECWNIVVKEQPFIVATTDEKEVNLGEVPEEIDKVYQINGTKIIVTLTDEEEVQAEKIKQYIWSNIDESGSFQDPQIRTDIRNFLQALIREENGYNTPVYKGMLQITNDHTLARWITSNLEMLWT